MFQIWKRNWRFDLITTISAHATGAGGRVGFLAKRMRILSIPSKPHSFHSVHSIGCRMNGMIFRSFRKRNSSQKNTNTVYSEYSYSGIVPKERAQRLILKKIGLYSILIIQLEIFFGRMPFCLPRRKWQKPSALVSGINQANGVYPMGKRHECCVYKPSSEGRSERTSEFWLLTILVSLAFMSKKELIKVNTLQ